MINADLEINNRFLVSWISVMSVTKGSDKHHDNDHHNSMSRIQFLNQDTCHYHKSSHVPINFPNKHLITLPRRKQLTIAPCPVHTM